MIQGILTLVQMFHEYYELVMLTLIVAKILCKSLQIIVVTITEVFL